MQLNNIFTLGGSCHGSQWRDWALSVSSNWFSASIMMTTLAFTGTFLSHR